MPQLGQHARNLVRVWVGRLLGCAQAVQFGKGRDRLEHGGQDSPLEGTCGGVVP